jgi:hypothetical protein
MGIRGKGEKVYLAKAADSKAIPEKSVFGDGLILK